MILHRVILHAEINLGEEFVTIAASKDVSNARHRVSFTNKHVIELAKVRHPTKTAIFFGSDECRICMLRGANRSQNTLIDKAQSFIIKHLLMRMRNSIGFAVYWNRIRFDIKMCLFPIVKIKFAIKEFIQNASCNCVC